MYNIPGSYARTIISCLLPFLFLAACRMQPDNTLNKDASVHPTDDLPESPLLLIPLTTSIQPSDSTMSTLYGNEIAAAHALRSPDTAYPPGAVLYEVTWKQQPDPVWFGGNIPQKIELIERVAFTGDEQPRYTIYKGAPLKPNAPENANERISHIISLKMATSP